MRTVTVGVASLDEAKRGLAIAFDGETARRLGRDVKGVHGDIHALLAAGILDRTADGQVVFPFDTMHVDFVLGAGA